MYFSTLIIEKDKKYLHQLNINVIVFSENRIALKDE